MAKHPLNSGTTRPLLTRDDIIHLVGDADDALVTAIIQTGATYVEVEEAVKWASGDAEDLGKEEREFSLAAEAVYDILASDPAFLGVDRDR